MFLRVVSILSIVVLLAVIGFNKFHHPPIEARDAIKVGVETVKKDTPLNHDEEDLLKLQLAILNFISKYGHPPDYLVELVPTYLDVLPKDPKTKEDYKYVRIKNNYRLGEQTQQNMVLAKNTQGKSDTGPNILPMEFINPNDMKEDTFQYDPTGKRDPFRQFDLTMKPNREGPLTPLERYGIGQLRLTATITDLNGQLAGLVEDAEGKGYTVRVGTKIGDRSGVIVSIEKDVLKILETTIDFTGKENQNVIEMRIQQTTHSDDGKSKSRKKKRQ